ncbi:septal ring lytic transglycosylase RlpA family protein [Pedobacter flavus]|uniref:Probable endolytic peptidoglycan transglycosylase RlpA n=1 Tax=Pedobacter flavus TaxID=3113906 RepID=A0ABU7H1J8_9SPHI|nr:septal ring lytic transglycosylase RlpA family protein [Pedobacter sp. VNH31]MEE1884942.1 septal ring lytic transglycosylase RlpA family protein [Pedobacter sp. VNH31]
MIKNFLTIFLIFFTAELFAQTGDSLAIDSCYKTTYATFYHKKFEGRKTTSGAKYRAKLLTAAHLTLPFGTKVLVKNLTNGKTVEVTINDRGPHSKKFGIDLSEQAARNIGMYKSGVAKVEIFYILPKDI